MLRDGSQENAHADTAQTGIAHVHVSRRKPACSCPRWHHFKRGPTTDTNRRADGTGADMGSAHWGPCSCARFPVVKTFGD